MKMNAGKRILLFFHWLFSLVICAAFAIYLIMPEWLLPLYNQLQDSIGAVNMKIIGGAILAVYLVLSIATICLILGREKRADRGFITVDSSETGRVRIAISAIEQMVRQSVTNIDGISEMKINIDSRDDSIVIGVAASIVNGSHVPTITMNMQRAIRQFVEMNCGVAVRSVAISINSVTSANDVPRRKRRAKDAPASAAFVPAPAPESQPAPAVFETPQKPIESEPDSSPEIDFNYKPHLELTPTLEETPASIQEQAGSDDDRFEESPEIRSADEEISL